MGKFCQVNKRPVHVPDKNNYHWIPPPEGSYELNVDGAFLPVFRVGGVGAVIRNDNGGGDGGNGPFSRIC